MPLKAEFFSAVNGVLLQLPFHRLDMTEVLLEGPQNRKSCSHPDVIIIVDLRNYNV